MFDPFRQPEKKRDEAWKKALARQLASAEGRGFLAELISRVNCGGYLSADPARIAMHNFSMNLLNDIATIDPKTAADIFACGKGWLKEDIYG